MKRVAVIGMGKMGLLHASLLNTIPGVKLVAFCEKSRLVRRFSRHIFTDIAMVGNVNDLADFGLDAVYVTTPPSSHYAVLDTLFNERICHDVFVEKPLTNSLMESKELSDLPIKLGVDSINMVGYNHRFGVTFQKAREIIEEGILGEPVYFEGYAFSSAFLSGGERGKNAGRGGVIKDLASHAIDLALWYLGDITIGSILSSEVSAGGIIDSVSFEANAGKELRGQIKASWLEPDYRLPEIGFIIKGGKGITLVVNDDKIELQGKDAEIRTWHKHDLNDSASFMLAGTDYLREDEAFIDAISVRRAIEPDFSTALKVDEIIHNVEMRILGKS